MRTTYEVDNAFRDQMRPFVKGVDELPLEKLQRIHRAGVRALIAELQFCAGGAVSLHRRFPPNVHDMLVPRKPVGSTVAAS